MASAAVLAAVYLYLDAHQPVALQRVVDGGYLAYYWLGLGILSSVGLGTGLHTFVLYLVSVYGPLPPTPTSPLPLTPARSPSPRPSPPSTGPLPPHTR